jgi:hypothetical protein
MIWVIKERWCTWSADALIWYNVGLVYYYNPITHKEETKVVPSIIKYKAETMIYACEDI